MIHEKVINFANELGVKLELRNASRSWVYDGTTIALYSQYIPLDEDEFERSYPLRRFSSHTILYELAHFIGAEEVQRSFPEYGLDWGIVVSEALGPLGSAYRSEDGRPTWTYEDAQCMRLVDHKEAQVQEFFAQQFCYHFGKKHEIPSQMELCSVDAFNTWDGYLAYKKEEARSRWESAWICAQRRINALVDTW